jgi:hypothetical protein
MAAEPTPAFVTNSVSVQNHGTLFWAAPAGWDYIPPKADATGRSPAMFKLAAAGGQPSLLFTVCWDEFGPKKLSPTDAELAGMVQTVGAAQFAPDSVEKSVALINFAGDAVHGSYASFTDRKLAATAAKDVPKTEARVLTIGTFRAGHLWGKFMLFADGKDGGQFNEALAVVKSLRDAPDGK